MSFGRRPIRRRGGAVSSKFRGLSASAPPTALDSRAPADSGALARDGLSPPPVEAIVAEGLTKYFGEGEGG